MYQTRFITFEVVPRSKSMYAELIQDLFFVSCVYTVTEYRCKCMANHLQEQQLKTNPSQLINFYQFPRYTPTKLQVENKTHPGLFCLKYCLSWLGFKNCGARKPSTSWTNELKRSLSFYGV